MIHLLETAQAVVDQLGAAVTAGVAAPAPTPTPAPSGGIDTAGIVGWLLTRIAPVMVVVLAFWVWTRARSGNLSQVSTAVIIVIIGFVMVGSAGLLVAFGDNLANVIFE